MQRGFPDLVEEHSSVIGILEETGASIGRSSKRSANVTKELAFEKCIDERGAVADSETLLSDWAHVMQGACNELLARAGGAGDENVRVVTRDFLGEVKNFEHRRTSSDDAVELKVL